MLDQLQRSLFEIQILVGGILIRWVGVICVNELDEELQGELMSQITSTFNESMSEDYFLKYVCRPYFLKYGHEIV